MDPQYAQYFAWTYAVFFLLAPLFGFLVGVWYEALVVSLVFVVLGLITSVFISFRLKLTRLLVPLTSITGFVLLCQIVLGIVRERPSPAYDPIALGVTFLLVTLPFAHASWLFGFQPNMRDYMEVGLRDH